MHTRLQFAVAHIKGNFVGFIPLLTVDTDSCVIGLQHRTSVTEFLYTKNKRRSEYTIHSVFYCIWAYILQKP